MRVEITFEIEVDELAGSLDELEKFISYSLNENGSIHGKNPFYVKYGDLEALPFSVRVRPQGR